MGTKVTRRSAAQAARRARRARDIAQAHICVGIGPRAQGARIVTPFRVGFARCAGAPRELGDARRGLAQGLPQHALSAVESPQPCPVRAQ